eukprot:6187888-Pleurochrysis_carterae.AAC.1
MDGPHVAKCMPDHRQVCINTVVRCAHCASCGLNQWQLITNLPDRLATNTVRARLRYGRELIATCAQIFNGIAAFLLDRTRRANELRTDSSGHTFISLRYLWATAMAVRYPPEAAAVPDHHTPVYYWYCRAYLLQQAVAAITISRLLPHRLQSSGQGQGRARRAKRGSHDSRALSELRAALLGLCLGITHSKP